MSSFVPPRSGAADRKAPDRPSRAVAGPRPARVPRQAPSGAGVRREAPAPRATAGGGLPEGLQTVMEAMSGFSLADVVVHRNSAEPSRLGAAAFAKGSEIHVAPGQERHLAHEAWHVVQQKQGRVKPTVQLKGGMHRNDDAGLEREADVMGARALASTATARTQDGGLPQGALAPSKRGISGTVIQAAKVSPVYHGAGQATRVTLDLQVGDWPSAGSAPGESSPPGWQQVVDLQLPNWVRFHVLNEKSGGAGVVENLVPTSQAVNQNGTWSTFETRVKQLADPQRGNIGGTPYACNFDANVAYYAAADDRQYRNAAGVVRTVQGAHFPSAIAATFTIPPVPAHGRDSGFAGAVYAANLGPGDGLVTPSQLNAPASWQLVVPAVAAAVVAAPVHAAAAGVVGMAT